MRLRSSVHNDNSGKNAGVTPFFIIIVFVISVLLVGCSAKKDISEGHKPQTLPSTHDSPIPPASQHFAPPGVYPVNVRVGIPAIDNVIEAVMKRNGDLVYNYVRFSNIPCSDDVPVKPTCGDGKPVGTKLRLFVAAGCRVAWTGDEAHLQQAFRERFATPLYVFAVYRANTAISEDVQATYRLVLAQHGGDQGATTLWLATDGTIVGLSECGGTEAVPKNVDFILPMGVNK